LRDFGVLDRIGVSHSSVVNKIDSKHSRGFSNFFLENWNLKPGV
jgi:hypothetical protein